MSNEEIKPLLGLIYENSREGYLPKDFSLPRPENATPFADGAIDGIAVYHIQSPDITDEIKETLTSALLCASNNDTSEADRHFIELGETVHMVNLLVPMYECLVENQDRLKPHGLIEYAINTMTKSTEKECIKAAMFLLSFFEQDDQTKYLINLAALCNEFTLFALPSIMGWDDHDMELMDLGKRVNGWGKIHIVRNIAPVNDEIKEWLLHFGIDNTIIPSYSAHTVYEKAEVEKLLSKPEITYPELHSIIKIIDAMLDEGPVRNISLVKNRADIFIKLFTHADRLVPLNQEDYAYISHIVAWIKEEGEDNKEIMDLSFSILKNA